MNGWHRLWILGSVILAVTLAVLAAVQISNVRPLISESTLEYFDSQVPPPKSNGEPTFHPDRPYYALEERKVITPAHYRREMDIAAAAEASVTKRHIAVTTAVIWLLASSAVLGIGYGVAWVVKGFKQVSA